MLNRALAHEYILHTLLLATIEFDRRKLVQCKGHEVYDALLEQTYNRAFKELQKIQHTMRKEGLSFQAKQRKDEFFTDYIFTQKGITEEICYAHAALKNQVLQYLRKYLSVGFM